VVVGLHRLVPADPLLDRRTLSVRADRLIDRVSVTASIVLAVVLCTSLGVVFWPRISAAVGYAPALEPAAPAYTAGERIDVPASWYSHRPRTLVVFARAACGACQNAQPFLKTLIASVIAGGGAVTIAGHRDSPADDAAFAKSLGVPEDAFVVFPAGLRVRVTPTVVLVSHEGVILHAWEGVGPDTKQQSIAVAVGAALR
jgi:hypothetical protein